MKKLFVFLPIAVLSLIIAACNWGMPIFLYNATGVEERAKSPKVFSGADLPQVGNGGKYSFIVLTDCHFGEKKYSRREEDFLKKFKSLLQDPDPALKPRFIVNLGDTLDGGHESEADDYNKVCAKWIELGKSELGTSDYKVFSILGNHDLYNNGWEVWKKKIYPQTSFYTFTLNCGGASPFDFWFLDTGNGTLGGNQIEELEEGLEKNSRPKIIFMHYPLYAGGIFYFAIDDIQERARLISDFASANVKYVFEGHYHPDSDYDLGPFKEADIGAYLAKKVFGLVTVDENAGSVSFVRLYY